MPHEYNKSQIESATSISENAKKELSELETTLLNIEQARPIDELTVEDVLTACPKIEKAVEHMVKNEEWSVPGYKEVLLDGFIKKLIKY